MKRNPITLITSGILLLIFVSMLFTFQVRQTEVGVVTTFGRYSRSVTDPGFRLRLPWPVQRVYKFDRRLQTFESKFDQSITRDQINILAKVYVGWSIAGDARTFLERFNGDVAAVERTLEPVIRDAKSVVLGSHNFSDLISTNEASLKFDEIEQEMLGRVQARARDDYGIEIRLLGLKQLGLPESITSTVFQRMRAERQRLSAKYQAEGEREAKIIRAQADGTANEILANAQAQGARILGDAEVKAQEYYGVFEKNPDLAIFLFQLRALEESLKEKSHLILDQQTPPFNLLAP
ncbi:MAG: Modulator of FtsH protease HflC [Verrucomicrobiota bacterium]|jgi:membrane protease subunit HflC